MIDMPLALVLSTQGTRRHVTSARPDAPVVAERTRPAPTRRTRIAMAGMLQRAATAVAPAECSPAR